MRHCLYCDHTFNADTWSCPQCGTSPESVEGFHAFAPELARENSGFDPSYFESLAAIEHKSFWFQARNRLIVWAMSSLFGNAAKVLEIGVGTGFVANALGKLLPQAEILGSDIHVEGLAFAAQRLQGTATLVQMDARHIPFRNEFDVICLFDVLEHIEEDEAVLAEVRRALKPRGGVLITVPQHQSLWGPADVNACHKRRYGRSELPQKLKKAGFDILLNTSFVSLLLPAMYLSRARARQTSEYDIIEKLQVHPVLNWFFEAVLSVERGLIRSGIRFPAGGSRLVAARSTREAG